MPLDTTQAPENPARSTPAGTGALTPAAPRIGSAALPLLALGLSALLHLPLALLPGLHEPASTPGDRSMAVNLQPVPSTTAPETSPSPPRDHIEPIEIDEPPPEVQPDEAPAAVDERPEPSDTDAPEERTDPATAPAETTAPPKPDATRLRRQVLGHARSSADSAPQNDQPRGLRFSDRPELPGRAGWLDEWVGPVRARQESWRNADGSHQSRTVLPNGQVLCSSIRAPTMAELFNPSHSAAVAMHRDCGRERPGSIDRDDPWLRLPATSRE